MTEVRAGEEAASQSIEQHLYQRLSKVIDPELGRSITDMGMIVSIEAVPRAQSGEDSLAAYDVVVQVELTVKGCPLSETITNQIKGAVASYPDARLTPHIEVSSMSEEKLSHLVEGLKEARRTNPFSKKGRQNKDIRHRFG
jgi:ATP-binding protein involved in chromosome partitioning